MGNKILPTLSLALKILNNTQINTKSTILTKIKKLSINGYNRGQHAQVFENSEKVYKKNLKHSALTYCSQHICFALIAK